ncbi:hypothetical protein ACFE04_005526 [Oxalis oulophora]
MDEHVVHSVVSAFHDFRNTKADFVLGVEEQVRCLRQEFFSILSLLHNAKLRQLNVREEYAELRDAAYDAEDALQTVAVQIASRKTMNVLERSVGIVSQSMKLYDLRLTIKKIMDRLAVLKGRLQHYTLPKQGEILISLLEKREDQRKINYPKHNVVGLEGDIEKVVNYLVDQQKQQHVVLSIFGMGGVGKTTLAKEIYLDAEVRRHFNCFAWKNISQEYSSKKEIWHDILFSLTDNKKQDIEEITKLTDQQLAEKLYFFLKENKCLVVLDAVWEIRDWQLISEAFPENEMDSKILLTSRNKGVALYASPRAFHHELQCLNEEFSWQLLWNITYMGKSYAGYITEETMEEEAKLMVKHCAGLPLAIIALGRTLATKGSLTDWEMVHKHIKLYLRRGGVNDALALSYYDLPINLRQCFLHLSQFPEDSDINVAKLIRMWVAEGFAERDPTRNNESMEQVAGRMLNELILRGMVSVGQRDDRLKVKTCCMHKVMRDLCFSKAKEENFIDIIDRSHNDHDDFVYIGKVRRLVVNLHGEGCQYTLKSIKMPHLRSLMCFFDVGCKSWILQKPVFENLKLLRVLDLDGAEFPDGKLPKAIGELIHMKFLSLRGAKVWDLPSSLGNLICLQTLDLLIDCEFVHVPNVICKMKNLTHLFLPVNCDDETKLELKILIKLQTLVNFPASKCDVKDLYSLTNLRELSIRRPFLIRDFGEVKERLKATLKHMRYTGWLNRGNLHALSEFKKE